MADNPGLRLLRSLPAIYAAADRSGQLQRLLGAFEEVLYSGTPGPKGVPGIEQAVDTIPSLFAPLGAAGLRPDGARTPEPFLPWLAGWVAFTPHAWFTHEPERLRSIIAGIVPLYGLRGTRTYLEELLKLCFDEITGVKIDENPAFGLRVGLARLGEDTFLARERPFWFRVTLDVRAPAIPSQELSRWQATLEERLRAIIDFAKPAHTGYDLALEIPQTGKVVVSSVMDV